jgi:hypothetical protein
MKYFFYTQAEDYVRDYNWQLIKYFFYKQAEDYVRGYT